MSLYKILLATSVTASKVLQCPPDKDIDPDFTLEIMHLQDITKGNELDIGEIGSLYAYIIDDLVATFPGKIKFGYAEFSDDASPDGNDKYSNYKCMNITRQLDTITDGGEAFKMALNVTPVDDYDTYNCGFKAMTLAMNTSPGALVNWTNSPTSFRVLSMNTQGPGKMVMDRLGCPLTTDYQNCPMAWAMASFDESKHGDATNSPTEEDMWRVGHDNRSNMSFINMVKPGPKTSSLSAYDWWQTYGIDMMGQQYNINVINDYATELPNIIYTQVMEVACVQGDKVNAQSAQDEVSIKPPENRALHLHVKRPTPPAGMKKPAKRAGRRI